MKILWIFFWGHHKVVLYLGVISMHFRVFFLGARYIMGDIFGVLAIPDIFFLGGGGVNERCLAPAYVWRKK